MVPMDAGKLAGRAGRLRRWEPPLAFDFLWMALWLVGVYFACANSLDRYGREAVLDLVLAAGTLLACWRVILGTGEPPVRVARGLIIAALLYLGALVLPISDIGPGFI